MHSGLPYLSQTQPFCSSMNCFCEDDLTSAFLDLALSCSCNEKQVMEARLASLDEIKAQMSFNQCGKINFANAATRRVYLLHFAPRHCVITEYAVFVVLFGLCPRLRRMLLRRSALKFLSVDGGAGNDAIAFCSALSCLDYSFLGCLDMTIVDTERLWEPISRKIPVFLSKSPRFADLFRSVHFSCKFLLADLKKCPSPVEVEAADVIVMTKLFPTTSLKERNQAVENIFLLMKGGCIFIFIGNVLDDVLRISSTQGLEVLYQTQKQPRSRSVRDAERISQYEILAVRKREFVYLTYN